MIKRIFWLAVVVCKLKNDFLVRLVSVLVMMAWEMRSGKIKGAETDLMDGGYKKIRQTRNYPMDRWNLGGESAKSEGEETRGKKICRTDPSHQSRQQNLHIERNHHETKTLS